MSQLPNQNPFELAKQIIQSFPSDEQWQEYKKLTLPDVIQTLQSYLDGHKSWEAVQSQMGGFGYLGAILDGNPRNLLGQENPSRPEVEGMLRHAQSTLAARRSNPHISPDDPDPIYKKVGLIRKPINKRLEGLVATIVEAAFYNVLRRTQGKDAKGPFITADGPQVIFETRAPFGDIRNQALAELENVKKEIAGMFFTQGEGATKEYRIVRQVPHPAYRQLPMCLQILFRRNEGEDFVNESQGKKIMLAKDAQFDPEAMEELLRIEETQEISHYYVMRQPERRAWVEKHLGVGRSYP